ncbi:MAG: ATP-binding cassette domain-containing protein [Propionibacteriaceae bacterium]|nr:ATP-binding cassette domain-containing protein [Propionibacteriaceae bacterium]
MNFPVTFSHLSLCWPDGTVVLDDISATFNTGRTGLIGTNGSGKTTILRLINGDLTPTYGQLNLAGTVAYLPQVIALPPTATLADLLGVREKLEALSAIESGSTDPDDYETLGDDWEIIDRVNEILRQFDILGGSLAQAALDRPIATLSGGETMVAAIAGCRLNPATITLLDEPTNNLDRVLRQAVMEMVRTWPGTLIVVSHDIGLLDQMDSIAEIYSGVLTVFGGSFSEWQAALAVEQAAAQQAEKSAAQQVRTAKRVRAETLERTARHLARGKAKAIGEGLGKSARNFMRDTAEAGVARDRGTTKDRVSEAQASLATASERVRRSEPIQIDLPDPGVHASKQILTLTTATTEFILSGPERVALAGRNGVGKTTLIESLLGRRDWSGTTTARGELFTEQIGYLPQRFDLLDETASALDNVSARAPHATQANLRAGLARLLLRGDTVFRPVASLSGGERFRVALACLLFAEPPPQLLILDEPTNNLDLTSVDQLVEALSSYRGAILIVSHDPTFLDRLGVTTIIELP